MTFLKLNMTTLLAIGCQSTEFQNSRNEDIAITVKDWKSYSFGNKKISQRNQWTLDAL